jgi:hypothetical protein
VHCQKNDKWKRIQKQIEEGGVQCSWMGKKMLGEIKRLGYHLLSGCLMWKILMQVLYFTGNQQERYKWSCL